MRDIQKYTWNQKRRDSRHVEIYENIQAELYVQTHEKLPAFEAPLTKAKLVSLITAIMPSNA